MVERVVPAIINRTAALKLAELLGLDANRITKDSLNVQLRDGSFATVTVEFFLTAEEVREFAQALEA